MRCLWTQSAQDINGFPPNFHPPDSSSRGIHKDSMGFKWFNQQSIGVICGKPKIFIEVGDELWHWFHSFILFYHVIGVERKTHFKDTLLSHYASNETQLQRWTFEKTRRHTEVGEKKQGTRGVRGVSQTLDRQNPMGVIPQGLSKNVVLTGSTQVKLRCYITNKI